MRALLSSESEDPFQQETAVHVLALDGANRILSSLD